MSENLGSGIYLDEQLDFEISGTGDIETVSGVGELQKDLSIQMIFQLDQYRGSPPTENTREKVASDVIQLMELDTRVDSVITSRLSVTFSDDNKSIEINAPARTNDGVQDLVFNI